MRMREALALGAVLMLLVCCVLPWYTHSTAGFTMHVYDLAEWTSLHPAVRSSNPALLTSFLLRMPLWTVVATLALIANRLPDLRWRWVVRAGAIVVALWFVPPVEFFSSARTDPNYRQMALLAVLSGAAVIGAMAVGQMPARVQVALVVSVLGIGVLCGWWGLARAQELFDNFAIDVRVGIGAWGYAVMAALAACIVIVPSVRSRRSASAAIVPGA